MRAMRQWRPSDRTWLHAVTASITYGCSLEHLVGCEGRPSDRTWWGVRGAVEVGCEGVRGREEVGARGEGRLSTQAITYGYSLDHIRLQYRAHTVAASISYGRTHAAKSALPVRGQPKLTSVASKPVSRKHSVSNRVAAWAT
eukprot:scaffold22481_cov49-Phaeocystis_antarctica.AAC.2